MTFDTDHLTSGMHSNAHAETLDDQHTEEILTPSAIAEVESQLTAGLP